MIVKIKERKYGERGKFHLRKKKNRLFSILEQQDFLEAARKKKPGVKIVPSKRSLLYFDFV